LTTVLAVALIAGTGCRNVPPAATGVLEVADLGGAPPGDPAAAPGLLDEGDRAWEARSETGRLEAARLAYWQAAAADPDLYDPYWKAARASWVLGDRLAEAPARADAFERGARTAQLGIGVESGRVEAHYYYAINLGLLGRERPSMGIAAVQEMIPHLEAAIDADPAFDRAGPLRILAIVYLRAPGWPVGIGDLEAGLEHARRAVDQDPDYPYNQFVLAEALVEDGRRRPAREAFALGEELVRTGSWREDEREGFEAEAARLRRRYAALDK